MSSFAQSLQIMLVGPPGAGKTAIIDFLIRQRLGQPDGTTLVIDACPKEQLSRHYLLPETMSSKNGSLYHVLHEVLAHPEGNSQWLDLLLAESPVPVNDKLDWLRLGARWHEPDTITQGRLSFSLRRLIRKTYPVVLIDGYSQFLLQTFQEEGLQSIVVGTPNEVEAYNLQELGLAGLSTPPAIVLTQADNSPLPESTKTWLRQHERSLLLGKVYPVPNVQTPSDALDKTLKDCFHKLDVGGLFTH